jgi:hypothetical protein
MVFLAIFAGILAATQVGKVHIALPAIRSDLALSLVAGSWLISGGRHAHQLRGRL